MRDSVRHRRHPRQSAPVSVRRPDDVRARRGARASVAASGRRAANPLGMDTRESGPEIARALTAGIEHGGGRGRSSSASFPRPRVAYLCRTSDAAAGISISASHNPFEDNGVKIFGHDGMKIPDAVEEQIEDELRAIRRESVDDSGRSRCEDNAELIERYERFLDRRRRARTRCADEGRARHRQRRRVSHRAGSFPPRRRRGRRDQRPAGRPQHQ